MTLKGSAGTYDVILKKGLSEQEWLSRIADEIIEKQEEQMDKAKSKTPSSPSNPLPRGKYG